MWSLFGYADPEPEQEHSGEANTPEPEGEGSAEALPDPTSEQPEPPPSPGGGFWSWFGYSDQPEAPPEEDGGSQGGTEAPAKPQDVASTRDESTEKSSKKTATRRDEATSSAKKSKKKKDKASTVPIASPTASAGPSERRSELPVTDVAATRARLQLLEAASAERQKRKEERAAEKRSRKEKLEVLLSEVSRAKAEVEEARASLRSSSASTTKSVDSAQVENGDDLEDAVASQGETRAAGWNRAAASERRQHREEERAKRAEAKAKKEALRREQCERLEQLIEDQQRNFEETARCLQQSVLDQSQKAAEILLHQQQVLAAAAASSARTNVDDSQTPEESPSFQETKAALEKAAVEQAARLFAEKKAAQLEQRVKEAEAKAAEAERKAVEAERKAAQSQKEDSPFKQEPARIYPKFATSDATLQAEAGVSPLHVVFRGFPLQLSRNLFQLQSDYNALQETVKEKEKVFAKEMRKVDDELDRKLREQAEIAERATRRSLMISQGFGKLSEYWKTSTLRLKFWALNALLAATRAEKERELLAKEAAVKAAEAAAAENDQKFGRRHKKEVCLRSGLLIIEHLCKDRLASALSCWLRSAFAQSREGRTLPGLVGDLSDERVRLSIAALACAREASLKAERLTAQGERLLVQKQAALGMFFHNKFRGLKEKLGEEGESAEHAAKLEDLTLGSYLARWRQRVTDLPPAQNSTMQPSDPSEDTASLKYNIVAPADKDCVERVAKLVASEMNRLRVESLSNLNI